MKKGILTQQKAETLEEIKNSEDLSTHKAIQDLSILILEKS